MRVPCAPMSSFLLFWPLHLSYVPGRGTAGSRGNSILFRGPSHDAQGLLFLHTLASTGCSPVCYVLASPGPCTGASLGFGLHLRSDPDIGTSSSFVATWTSSLEILSPLPCSAGLRSPCSWAGGILCAFWVPSPLRPLIADGSSCLSRLPAFLVQWLLLMPLVSCPGIHCPRGPCRGTPCFLLSVDTFSSHSGPHGGKLHGVSPTAAHTPTRSLKRVHKLDTV